MSDTWFYVCDRCGDMTKRAEQVHEGEEWTCPECGSNAAWEFPHLKRMGAQEQSDVIKQGMASGLFRR